MAARGIGQLQDPRTTGAMVGAVGGSAFVLVMLVLIVGSARVLAAADRSDLVPAAVAAAVGLHFLPFARAFRAPVFTVLGAAMVVVGVLGVVVGLAGVGTAGAAAAVVAGLVMIVVITTDAAR